MHTHQIALIAGLALVTLGACGDDEDPKKPTPDAGRENREPDAGKPPAPMLQCGTNSCTLPSAPYLDLLGGAAGSAEPELCCVGESDELCGVTHALLAPD